MVQTIEQRKEKRREQERLKRKKRRKENEIFLVNFKNDKCCVNCGYKKHPEILVFHHTNPKEKKEEISLLKKKPQNKMKAEMDKCILLCPNCHALIHYLVQKNEKNN